MFGARAVSTLRLTLSVCLAAVAVLPSGAFLCVDATGHARFEVAAVEQLSPIDHPGHRDEGLPDCPGGGHHPRPCRDYRLGAFHDLSRSAGVTCPEGGSSFASLLLIEDLFAFAPNLLTPTISPDVGDPPDCRPQRVALRI